MTHIDEKIKMSELDKNEAEAGKARAEIEKINEEKKRTEFEIKSMKLTFWLKPIIAGIALGLTLYGLYQGVFKDLQYVGITEEKKKNADLGLENSQTKRRLDSAQLKIQQEEREFADSIKRAKDEVAFITRQVIKEQQDFKDSLNKAIKNNASATQISNLLKRSTIINVPVIDKSILWVDDNPENNELYRNFLVQKGLKVDNASSTAIAEEKINSHSYSAIISDMNRKEYN